MWSYNRDFWELGLGSHMIKTGILQRQIIIDDKDSTE